MKRILTARELGLGELPDRFCRSHGIEGTRHQLCRARATRVIGGLCLKQLGVRQDDSQLIVEPMEEESQVSLDSWTIGGAARLRPASVCTGH